MFKANCVKGCYSVVGEVMDKIRVVYSVQTSERDNVVGITGAAD